MSTFCNRHAVVTAQQFDPENHPWPRYVRQDVDSSTGYSVALPDGKIGYEVYVGDYIVYLREDQQSGDHVQVCYPVRDQHFEHRYQPCES